MSVVVISILSAIVGGWISFATSYFSNLQRYKQDVIKQNFDHNHELVKQDFEHKYDRRVFLRQKYEELTFRLIDFTNILKIINSQLSQLESGANIDTTELDEKGAKIEIITVLYFPELTIDCECFLAVSRKLLLAHGFNDSSEDIDSREVLQVSFNKAFDTLYDKVKNHISDYT